MRGAGPQGARASAASDATPRSRTRGPGAAAPQHPRPPTSAVPCGSSPQPPPRARRLRSAPAPPLPPPKMASRRPSPGSALPAHNAARRRDVTGPRPGGGARRGALRTRRKGALGRGGAVLDSGARAPRSCSLVSRGLVAVCQAPSSRVRLPGARRRGPEGPSPAGLSEKASLGRDPGRAHLVGPSLPRDPRESELQRSLQALPSATQASHEPPRQGLARAELPAPQPPPARGGRTPACSPRLKGSPCRPESAPGLRPLHRRAAGLTQQPARSTQAGSGEGAAEPGPPPGRCGCARCGALRHCSPGGLGRALAVQPMRSSNGPARPPRPF